MANKNKFKVGDLVEFKGPARGTGLLAAMKNGIPDRGEIGIITLIPDQKWQPGWVDVVFPSGQAHIKLEEIRMLYHRKQVLNNTKKKQT